MKLSWLRADNPRVAFALGSGSLMLGVGYVALAVWGGMSRLWVWLVGSAWLVVAVCQLGSAVVMKRRAHSAARGGGQQARPPSSSW